MPNGSTAGRPLGGYERDDAKIAALEQRVYGLERGVHDLSAQLTSRFAEVGGAIAGLTAKLDERSKTPWATIVSAMGVVLAIVVAGGQLAKTPIDDAIDRLERDATSSYASIASLRDRSVSRDEFEEFKRTYEANRLNFRQDYAAKIAEIIATISKLERETRDAAGSVVPRGEHQERWRSQDAAVAAVQAQVNDLKAALGGIYGARDVILDLRERLDRVERTRIAPP